MEESKEKSKKIRKFILDHVAMHPSDIVKVVAQKFSISRQAAARHLKKLVLQGDIETVGNTSGRMYHLSKGRRIELSYLIDDGPDAEDVWKADVLPLMDGLPAALTQLWHCCFVGIFSNSILHSGGTFVHVKIVRKNKQSIITVADDGKGLFEVLRKKMRLEDNQLAAIELARRLPDAAVNHHPRMNIPAASHMADVFTIHSGRIVFTYRNSPAWDWTFDTSSEVVTGTRIVINLENAAQRTMECVFRHNNPSETDAVFGTRVCIPIKLAQASVKPLFSRAQARRILAGAERFAVTLLDFEGVDTIGPAFADQIFRVFPSEYPRTQLLYRNANRNIETIILAAKDHSARAASFKR